MTPTELTNFCSEDELENLTNIEHLAEILNRILKRLDNLEAKKK